MGLNVKRRYVLSYCCSFIINYYSVHCSALFAFPCSSSLLKIAIDVSCYVPHRFFIVKTTHWFICYSKEEFFGSVFDNLCFKRYLASFISQNKFSFVIYRYAACTFKFLSQELFPEKKRRTKQKKATNVPTIVESALFKNVASLA